jgi:ubiquinone/menaquinone biosynthesis C-methylase UbiE
MERWVEGEPVEQEAWESAYARFETSEQEARKFVRRLHAAGAHHWPRQWRIVDLFCGRGNGLQALQRLGFEHLAGVDLSPGLLARYSGPATLYVGDCRALRFDDRSIDAVTIHGGLHHLRELPGDLERVLSEVQRVLQPQGRLLAVEPWQTPFLTAVHAACRMSPLRRAWPKLDALARMIELEQPAYPRWLARASVIAEVFDRHFVSLRCTTAWGKRSFLGKPR